VEHSPLRRLVAALRDPRRFPHPVDDVAVVETHISVVLLAGEHAYKLKKPVDLGFLDYSTLDLRRRACHEELRRNARLAPGLYETVVAFSGSPDAPELTADTESADDAFEVAVRMRRFPQEAQLDRRLEAGALRVPGMERVAETVAAYQDTARRVGAEEPHGRAEDVWRPIAENFAQILPRVKDRDEVERLERLRTWAGEEHARQTPLIAQRRESGFVRSCHGDLHLSNLVEVEGRIVAFDCIEFDPNLYRIDVISDAAFLVMDLLVRDRRDLAATFLDRWLQRTGDFDALPLLRHYLCYRSMVRAKVAAIAMAQHSGADRTAHHARYSAHLELAERIAYQAGGGGLVIATGLAGSGKSTVARALVPHLAALRVSSDRERKRLFGLGETEASGSPIDGGIYTPEAHGRTYDRMAVAARAILRSGHVGIVDGAFLREQDRARFRAIAAEATAPAIVLHCTAPGAVLLERVRSRQARGDDASEAGPEVLSRQVARAETPPEGPGVLTIETTLSIDGARAERLAARIASELANATLPGST